MLLYGALRFAGTYYMRPTALSKGKSYAEGLWGRGCRGMAGIENRIRFGWLRLPACCLRGQQAACQLGGSVYFGSMLLGIETSSDYIGHRSSNGGPGIHYG